MPRHLLSDPATGSAIDNCNDCGMEVWKSKEGVEQAGEDATICCTGCAVKRMQADPSPVIAEPSDSIKRAVENHLNRHKNN